MSKCGICRCSSVRAAWLIVFIVAYLAAGAAVFQFLEVDPEKVIRNQLRQDRSTFLERNPCVPGSLSDLISGVQTQQCADYEGKTKKLLACLLNSVRNSVAITLNFVTFPVLRVTYSD